MRIIFAIAAIGVLATAPAYADDKAPKKDDSQKVICKTEEFVGSLIPRRICKTKADWEQGETDAKRALDNRKMGVDPVSLGKPANGGG